MESRFGCVFAQQRTYAKASDFIAAISDEQVRGNAWAIAERAGYETPGPFQSLLCENKWDAGEVWDGIALEAESLVERDCLDDPLGPGVAVDETACEKRGKETAGVSYQYAGCAGRVTNCTNWVAATLIGSTVRTWIACTLYIPKKTWFTGRKETGAARRRKAGIPKGTRFQSKPEIARAQFRHLRKKGVKFNWASGDEVYGRSRKLLGDHEKNGEAYAYFVPRDHMVMTMAKRRSRVDKLRELAEAPFELRSAGPGLKGPRYYEWAMIGVISPRHFLLARRPVEEEMGDSPSGQSPAGEKEGPVPGGDRVKDEMITFCLCYIPAGSPIKPSMANLVLMAGKRWGAEEGNATAKGPIGWDNNQSRKWESLNRHAALTGLAMLRAHLMRDFLVNYASSGETAPAQDEIAAETDRHGKALPPPGDFREPAPGDLRIPLGDSEVPVHADQDAPREIGFIKLSLNEIMRLMSIVESNYGEARMAFHLRWSKWRRKHQATSRWYHQIARLKASASQCLETGGWTPVTVSS